MTYAEEKIARALQRGDARATEYWRHVYAAADACAPRVDGQIVELLAVIAATPRREAPVMNDTPAPLPARRSTTRVPLGELADRAAEARAKDAEILFNSSI